MRDATAARRATALGVVLCVGWAAAAAAADTPVTRVHWLEGALVAFGALLLALLPWGVLRAVRSLDRRSRVVFAVAAGVALIARVIAPHRLVMVYFGYEHVGQAVDLHSLPRYGPGATMLWWLLFRFAPPDHAAVQWLHAFLGSVSVGLWTAYVHRVAKSLFGAALVAASLAVGPLFVRDHVSESMGVPALLALAAAAVLSADVVGRLAAGRTRPHASLVAIVALILFAASCRPDLIAMGLPFALAFALAGNPMRDVGRALRTFWPYALAGILVAVPLAAWSWIQARADLELGNLPRVTEHFLAALPDRLMNDSAIFRPQDFPVGLWLPVLAATPFSAGARRAWWLVLAALLSLPLTFVDYNEVSILRLHVPAATLVAVAGGLALAGIAARGRWGLVAAALLLAGALASSIPSVEPLFRARNPDQEEALVRETLAVLEAEGAAGAELVRLGYGDLEIRDVHLHFPDYLFTDRGIRTLRVGELFERGVGARTYFLRSLRCYLWPGWDPGSPKGAPHPACERVCRERTCETVFERDLPNLGDWPHFDGYGSAATLRVGLYRVR